MSSEKIFPPSDDESGATDASDRRGLRWRMLVTLAVVVTLPFAFVYALGSVPNGMLYLTTADYDTHVVPSYDPLLVGGVVLLILLVQYWLAPRLALEMEDAEPADESEYPRLHAAAQRAAQAYDLPKPQVGVVDNEAPNAFVVGRSADSAVLVVTEGLLDALDDDELDAVAAHELAHVRNRDGPLMSVAATLPAVTYWLAVSSKRFMRSVFGRSKGKERSRSTRGGDTAGVGRGVAAILLIVAYTMVVGIAVFFWTASVLAVYLLSRQREYVADAAAAEATGDPAALAGALRTIDDGLSETPDRDLRDIDGGAETLFVAPIESGNLHEDEKTLLNTDLFPASHPPTEDRIDRLQRLAREDP